MPSQEVHEVSLLSPEEYVDVLARTGLGMVCKLDRSGRILTFDDACERVTGYTAAEVIGRDARDMLIPPEERNAFGVFLEQFADIAVSRPQVGHWVTKDGERRQIAWSNRPITDEDGAVTGLLTVGLDLSERDRAAAQVEALHSELEDRLAEVEVLAREQAALRRVATLVAGEADPALIFEAVAVETGRLARVRTAAVVRYGSDGACVVGRWSCASQVELFPVGSVVPLGDDTAFGAVQRTGASARVDAYGDGAVATRMREAGYVSAAAAPVLLSNQPWGAVIVASGADEPLNDDVEHRLAPFAALLALAVASAEAREQLMVSRTRLVAAADEERRRLERDLHDGAQQRLVTLVLSIGVARRKVTDEAVGELLSSAERDAREALSELRHLATGLHPPILSEGGLPPAIAALARRAPLEVQVDHVADERFHPTIEVAAYYVVAEALTNVVKHAEAEAVRVSARRDGHTLVVMVQDDGRGGADPQRGTGLIGLTDRVEALRGALSISSSRNAGTLLRAEFPLARE
ncbi:MAG TPA: PAS domain S-box protein [Gaiellaceae bacterium]|nr:PAS domain S-box protein [Gaiellaceae bacterium]